MRLAHDHFGDGRRAEDYDSRFAVEDRQFQVADPTRQHAEEDAVDDEGGARAIRCQKPVRCSIDQRLAEAGDAQVPDAGTALQPQWKGHERKRLNTENPR